MGRRLMTLCIAALLSATASAQHTERIRSGEPAEDPEGRIVLSGEVRERGTYLSALNYDRDDTHAGWFWTQRVQAAFDVEATPWLRTRVSLLSALQEGGEVSPVERNNLAVQEAFADLGTEDAYLRLGRQELRLGSQRFVGTRDGTNVRRNWDGVRGVFQSGRSTLQAFGLHLVDVEPDGIFNDESTDENQLAGIYATTPILMSMVDLYYLNARRKDRFTIEGNFTEDRHTVGARVFGERHGWFWDWEAAGQLGRAGPHDIEAWTIAANTGYRWAGHPWTPEIELSTNIASGDDGRGGEFGTFDALFPRGSYFSEAAILGPSNFFNAHPYIRAHPHTDMTVFADMNFYWRLEEEDGVYGPSGSLIRAPQNSDERFVATEISAGAEWEPVDGLLFAALYTFSEPRRFIEETGPDDQIHFVELTMRYRF